MSDGLRFMLQAIALATENVLSGRGGPFGAVVVRDGVVIATGVNLVTSTHDATAHAEMTAIRNACEALGEFQLDGCDVYTSCEPCPMCLAAMYWAKCRAVFYGNTSVDAAMAGFADANLYDEIRKASKERSLPMQRMLGDEALKSFALWTKTTDKVLY